MKEQTNQWFQFVSEHFIKEEISTNTQARRNESYVIHTMRAKLRTGFIYTITTLLCSVCILFIYSDI